MNGFLSSLVFIAGVIVIVILTSQYNVPPFFALFLVAVLVALLTGIPLESIGGIVSEGFSKVLGYTAIIMVSAIIVGEVMQRTGAIYVISRSIIRVFGKKRSHYAMGAAGFTVALPVLCCDTAFIMLSPLAEALISGGMLNPMSVILSLAAGTFASYALLFPAAPLLPVTIFGADIASALILGFIVSIPTVLLGLLVAERLAERFGSNIDVKDLKSIDDMASGYGKLPNPWLVTLILLTPIALIVGRSVLKNFLDSAILPYIEFLGDPVIALPIGVGLSMLLAKGKPIDEINQWVSNAITRSASILMIIGTGSILALVLQRAGIGSFLAGFMMSFNIPALLVVFLIAALMKAAQGGTTVTMITVTAIISPILSSLELNPVMAAMAICAGAMIFVHVNDSFFWVVTGFSKMDVTHGYKTLTIMFAAMGIIAFLMISLLGPTILNLIHPS